MGRRKESLAATVIQLSWWVGLALAGAVYLFLAVLAPLLVPEENQFAPVMVDGARTWGKIFAVLFVALSIGSAVRAFFARRLLDRQTSIESVRELGWRQFEELVAEAFRRRGYAVMENGGGGADGGVDVILRKEGRKILVQCKHWQARQIGVTTVRELKGVMATTGAVCGFVVASGTFTAEARAFAENASVELIDGPMLTQMIEEVRGLADADPKVAATVPVPRASATLECPKCGSPMIKRTAKRGSNVGAQFWGCSSYTGCRGTLPVSPS